MTNIDTKQIMADVKANHAKLESCDRHDFSQPIDRRTKEPIPERVVFCDWRCVRCGGWVDCHAKHWFDIGVRHGGAK